MQFAPQLNSKVPPTHAAKLFHEMKFHGPRPLTIQFKLLCGKREVCEAATDPARITKSP
jgi:hypothetical protein